MRLLVINGSYHKHGNTAALVQNAIDGFKTIHPDAKVETIDIIDKDINFCGGCKKCGRNHLKDPIGVCEQQDDTRDILNKMLDCDRIILASPIYYGGVTAMLKRFIERTLPFSTYLENKPPKHRISINKNRKGVVILSSDCPYPLNKLMLYTFYPKKVLKTLIGLAGMKYIGHIASSPYQKNYFTKQAFKLGEKLAK